MIRNLATIDFHLDGPSSKVSPLQSQPRQPTTWKVLPKQQTLHILDCSTPRRLFNFQEPTRALDWSQSKYPLRLAIVSRPKTLCLTLYGTKRLSTTKTPRPHSHFRKPAPVFSNPKSRPIHVQHKSNPTQSHRNYHDKRHGSTQPTRGTKLL